MRRLTNCANIALSAADSFKLGKFTNEVWEDLEAFLSLYDPLKGFVMAEDPVITDYIIGEVTCEEVSKAPLPAPLLKTPTCLKGYVETTDIKPKVRFVETTDIKPKGVRVDLAAYEAAKEKHSLSVKAKHVRRRAFDATCNAIHNAVMSRDWDTAVSLVMSLKYPYQKDLVRILMRAVKQERELLKPAIERARRKEGVNMIKEGLNKLF